MTRRKMHTTLTLIALAGLAGPGMAQDATKDAAKAPPQRERVRQNEDGATREDAMARRKAALDAAVERGTLTRERADAMMERAEAAGADGERPERGAMRDRFGADELPAQLKEVANLREDQNEAVSTLIRELRQKQMEALRELRGGEGPGGPGAAGDDARPRRGADGDDARPARGEPGERGGAGAPGAERRGPRDADAGDGAKPEKPAKPEKGAPLGGPKVPPAAGNGARDGSGGGPGEMREGGPRGPQGEDGPGMRGGFGGPGAFMEMSEEEREAFVKDVAKKLIPINKQFGKDLAEVLDKEQAKAVRGKWESLSINPPMIERLIEATKQAKQEAKDEAKEAKDGKDKAKDADAMDDDTKAKARPGARREGRRGRPGDDD